MGGAKQVRIEDVRRQLESPGVETRASALNALLIAMQRRPELLEPARGIFRHALERETYSWAVTTSLTGVERLDGPEVARPLWRRFLTQPDAAAAGRVAMHLSHPSHLPMLLEILQQRPDFAFRTSAIYAMGRMADPAALPTLLQLGQDEALQPAVVQAMSDLGDPRALLWLEPLVNSDRHLPELDEKGATWTLGDVAAQAIRRIQYVNRQPGPPPLPSQSPHTPPPLPRRPAYTGRAVVWPAGFTVRAALQPSLLPLVFAALEGLWLVGLFALYLFMVGDEPPKFTVSDRAVDALALPLPVLGVISTVVVLLGGRSPRWWHKVLTLAGGGLCAFLAISFGYGLITG